MARHPAGNRAGSTALAFIGDISYIWYTLLLCYIVSVFQFDIQSHLQNYAGSGVCFFVVGQQHGLWMVDTRGGLVGLVAGERG